MKSSQPKIKKPKIYKSVEEASNAKYEVAKETIRRVGIEKIAALK